MMKKMKKLVTVFAAAAAMLLTTGAYSLKAEAAEPATYHFFYDAEKENSEEGEDGWYVLTEADMQEPDEAEHKVMQFFYNEVRDGDQVVIHDGSSVPLDLGTVSLSDVTMFFESGFTMIKAGHIRTFNALGGSSCSITASIDTANLYNPCVVTLVNDTPNINVIVTGEDDFNSTIGCGGTVGCLNVTIPHDDSYTLYNFKKDTLSIVNGYLETAETDYDKEPSSTPKPVQPTNPPAGNPADEYDEVPKTGETNTVLWLLCAGALCMALSLGFRKASQK